MFKIFEVWKTSSDFFYTSQTPVFSPFNIQFILFGCLTSQAKVLQGLYNFLHKLQAWTIWICKVSLDK